MAADFPVKMTAGFLVETETEFPMEMAADFFVKMTAGFLVETVTGFPMEMTADFPGQENF